VQTCHPLAEIAAYLRSVPIRMELEVILKDANPDRYFAVYHSGTVYALSSLFASGGLLKLTAPEARRR